jgi:allantoin racemase
VQALQLRLLRHPLKAIMNTSTAARLPLRIWHQSMTELQGLGAYRDFLVRHARAVLGNDAVLQVEGLKTGSYHGRTPSAVLGNAFVHHRVLDQVIDNAIRAQHTGFDAFVIGSFSEPYLREIRSAVDIPVLSILESSVLVGCMLGHKVAPISNAPSIAQIVQHSVDAHGLGQRVLPAVSMDPPMHEPEMAGAFAQPAALLKAFEAAARRAIAQGAEVIIPAEGVLSTVISDNRVVSIGGAPVIDVFAVTWRQAVMMVRLRTDCGLQVSRVGAYEQADPELIRLLAK